MVFVGVDGVFKSSGNVVSFDKNGVYYVACVMFEMCKKMKR